MASNLDPVTFGIQWHRGEWWVHLMWQTTPPRYWRASRRMLKKRYKTLEGALLAMSDVEAVMIFPAQREQ